MKYNRGMRFMGLSKSSSFISALLLLTLFISGCRDPLSTLPTTRVRIGDKDFTLEIADSERDRLRGLMHREFMPDNHGMIFVWVEEAPRGFYMKNTIIPLDILFLSASGKVVSINQLEPLNENPVPSGAPARWAIELNQGMADKANVKVGDVILIPKEAGGAD